MSQKEPSKEQLVDGLLHSLHYGESKEDRVMIAHLCTLFSIPSGTNLRDYLIKEVDFSYLFAKCLQLVEPFTEMLNQIYAFLAKHRTSARTASAEKAPDKELRQLLIGENMQDQLLFDLEAFPVIKKKVLQQIPRSRPIYDKKKALNDNISPLFLTDQLRDFGINEDEMATGNVPCPTCNEHFKERFRRIFAQLEILISSFSEKDIPAHLTDRIERYRHHFREANVQFRKGLHTQDQCPGYGHWQDVYHTFLQRFERISTDETWQEQVQGLLRFFELPFWEKRSQLYEVWVLIHFLHCLENLSIRLNIRRNKWNLMYTKAKEPVAWIDGDHFRLEIWFQRLQEGKIYQDKHIMPDILVMGCECLDRAEMKPLILIECKEQEGHSEDSIYKLASHYHEQIHAERHIYCNYLRYSQPLGLKKYRSGKEIICDGFQPGASNISIVDQYFLGFLNRKVKRWAGLCLR